MDHQRCLTMLWRYKHWRRMSHSHMSRLMCKMRTRYDLRGLLQFFSTSWSTNGNPGSYCFFRVGILFYQSCAPYFLCECLGMHSRDWDFYNDICILCLETEGKMEAILIRHENGFCGCVHVWEIAECFKTGQISV